MIQKFFYLHSLESTSKRAEWVHEEMKLEAVKCPIDAGHQHPGRRLTSLSVRIPRTRVLDFTWTWYSECLISDRVLAAFRSQKFRGFEALPVRTNRPSGKGRLWELALRGWGGLADPVSGVSLKEKCQHCGFTNYSRLRKPDRLIDVKQWDGSDFFMVWPLPRFVFITGRVRDFILDHKYSGVDISEISGLLEIWHAGYSPGVLRYWLPAELARKYGKPLDIY